MSGKRSSGDAEGHPQVGGHIQLEAWRIQKSHGTKPEIYCRCQKAKGISKEVGGSIWKREGGESSHTKKIGICRPGGKFEYDSFAPDVV